MLSKGRADYELHLTTLFPEIRLKNTIEVRPNDGLPPHLAMSAVALWTGLLYDDAALDAATELAAAEPAAAFSRGRV